MLRISFSNRFETLLDDLLDALADPPESPFESQQVIVPSVAVRRKVELAIAAGDYHGTLFRVTM